MTYLRMADAAFAENIPPGFDVAAGYYGGPDAYHVWAPTDWERFPGWKLPLWVAGMDGSTEGAAAAAALGMLGLGGRRIITALDMETRVDRTYVERFGAELRAAGYLVWVYGSANTVYENPPLNGYWVADYTSNPRPVIQQVGVRAVQYLPDLAPGYDQSIVKAWTSKLMWGQP